MSARTVRVGEVAEQIRGVSYAKDEASGEPGAGRVPILRAGNITDAGLRFDDLVFVPLRRVADTQKIRCGDVVIATSSGSLDVVGKAAVAATDFDGGFGAFCKVLRPNSKVHPSYFAHFFKTQDYRARVSALAAGASINNLRNEHLDDLELRLPTLDEQQRIAEVLDRAEALRTARVRALATLDELGEALFRNMFGDPVANPRQWPRKPIAYLGDIVTGNTPSRANSTYFGDDIEWIKSDNISRSMYYVMAAEERLSDAGKAVARTVPAGSVLVTCIAGSPNSIGNAAMTDREVAFNQQINALIPHTGNRHFILGQLRVGQRLVQDASTGGMKGLVSKSRFGAIELVYPPIDLQNEYARQILAVERLRNAQRAALVQLNTLVESLQHRAFRGEL